MGGIAAGWRGKGRVKKSPSQLALLDAYGLPAKHDEPSPTSTASTAAPRRSAPLAANDDPDTSHLAAERAQVSERQKSLSRRVFTCVASRTTPPTFHEIAREIGEEDHAVMKRLNQLRHERRVEHTPKRICSVTGSLCVGWRAIALGSTTVPTASNDPRRPAPIQPPAPPSDDRMDQQSDPATVQQPASNPATCGLCKGRGVIRTSNNPPNYAWCDEVRDRRCTFAEVLRRLHPDPNHFGFAGEAA